MTATGRNDYDVVIAGGGMIGACLAVALEPLGLKIAVVEAVSRSASLQPSFDDRSTALSRSSQRMFSAMGLWDEIVAAATPITRIHVSERGRFGFAHIDAAEQKVEALGHVVINRVLGGVLQSALARCAQLDFLCPARIAAVRTSPDGATITVARESSTDELTCSLLVAADGAESSVREMLGIGVERRDYRQQAVVGNVMPQYPPDHRAFERFLPDGALALLPVAESRAAFVWAMSEEAAIASMNLSDSAFTTRLQDAFGNRLGRFDRLGRRASYALRLSKAGRLTAPRAVLVGNAAHGLHPIAAQGFNLGMRDAATLSDCIADVLSTGEDKVSIGGDAVLARYSTWRYRDHLKIVHFTDGLVRLFGVRRGPLPALRAAGMLGFDLVPGVRSLFAKHTMGLAGRLPRLSRGVPLR